MIGNWTLQSKIRTTEKLPRSLFLWQWKDQYAWGSGKKQLTKYIAKGTSNEMDVEYGKKWNELEKYTSGNPCFWKPNLKQFLAE